MEKYFMHRIQKTGDTFSKGIEIHDTLDSAILSFWGRMKTAYGGSDATFVSCKITNASGGIVAPYDMTWQKEGVEQENKFFFHHIKLDGENFDKNIDVCDTFDSARVAYASAMEYGYNNSKFPNVDFVSCEITDMGGLVLDPYNETWIKETVDPEPEA